MTLPMAPWLMPRSPTIAGTRGPTAAAVRPKQKYSSQTPPSMAQR